MAPAYVSFCRALDGGGWHLLNVRVMIQRRKVIIGAAGLAAVATAAGCSESGKPDGATGWVEPAGNIQQAATDDGHPTTLA